jgi:hypothetical protein
MTSPDTGADSALPGMVAPFLQIRVFVISQPDLTLIWRSREQR